MLTVRECAARACVCEGVVRGWLRAGLLPHFRVGRGGRGGKYLVLWEDLDALMASFRVGPPLRPSGVPRPPPAVKLTHLKL